jgi:predicted peptidase
MSLFPVPLPSCTRLLGILGFVALCCGCHSSAVVRSTQTFEPGTGFAEHQITVDGEPRTLWVFVPRKYQSTQRYPAILFLHGLFEAGNGYGQSASAGLGPVIAKDPDHWPFITIFPQSDGNWRGDARDRLAMASLDFAMANWSVDKDRVILAGLSYGGLGTWEIGARHAERFAALVPVSGHRATQAVDRLAHMPVWAFAYSGDPWVNAQSSLDMCRDIADKGGQPRLTEFPGVGHDCWDKAVAESDLVPWMLQQRRGTTIVARPDTATVAQTE